MRNSLEPISQAPNRSPEESFCRWVVLQIAVTEHLIRSVWIDGPLPVQAAPPGPGLVNCPLMAPLKLVDMYLLQRPAW